MEPSQAPQKRKRNAVTQYDPLRRPVYPWPSLYPLPLYCMSPQSAHVLKQP